MASDQIGLVLPTSLCARRNRKAHVAAKLNRDQANGASRISRYVALATPRVAGRPAANRKRFRLRTMAGYLCHPWFGAHCCSNMACEKTHNDAIREFFEEHGPITPASAAPVCNWTADWKRHRESREMVRRGQKRQPPPRAKRVCNRYALALPPNLAFLTTSASRAPRWFAGLSISANDRASGEFPLIAKPRFYHPTSR